jgi:Arc/MetJ-type ribon-helix-helix transcriptional regulator
MPPSSSEVLPFNLSHRRSAVYPWLRSNGKGHRWSAEPGRGKGQGAERLPAGRPGIPLEPHLAAYAERLVEAGKAPSVSAVVNDALEARQQRDLKARRLWREAAERADPDQIARMLAHVEAQAAQLPASHR